MSIKGVAMRESSGETVVLLVTMGEQSFNEFYRTLLAFIKNACHLTFFHFINNTSLG